MNITYNGKSVLAIFRNGTAIEQALIAWNWTPQQLYFGGVRGAVYVPDLSTVYGAGAASFGAGIATILDEKSGPPVIGPELVVNGTFINDASGWTIDGGSVAVIGGELAITSENSVVGRVYQIVPVVIGKRYIVKATIRNGTSTCRFRVGTSLNGLQYGAYTDSFNAIFTAITNEMHLTPQNGGTVGTSYHSNISVREIAANPATQSSTSLRPLFGRSPLVKRNILIQTEDFSSTAWSKSLVTFQSAANNRWKIIPNLVSATALNIGQIPGPSFPDIAQTFTGYFESAGARYVSVRVGTQSNRFSAFSLDLNTGIVTTGASGASASATSVAADSGWFVTFQYTLAAGTNGNTIIICPSIAPIIPGLNPLCSGNGVDGVIVGQPQMELSSVATPYQRVGAATDITESGVTSYPFIRMDLSDDALITSGMGSTKNLLRFTEEFDNAYWTKDGATTPVTSNTAPNGTATAETLTETATTGAHGTYRVPAGAFTAGTYTLSCYLKQGTARYAHLLLNTTAGYSAATFDLQDGLVTKNQTGGVGVTSPASPTIVSVGSGWYRATLTATTNANINAVGPLISNSGTPAYTLSGGVSYAGNTANNILIWGAQLETGSTATEYEYGGLKGIALVAGRNGTLVESVTLPDGNFTLGPTAVTSGTPGLLRAVGDIVGYNLINKTLTAKERKYLIEYYKDRGAKGMLVSNGPELITNGSFDYDGDWTKAGSTTIQGGAAVIVNGSGSSLTQDPPGLIFGKWYLLTTVISGLVSGNVIVRTVSSGGGISATPTYTTNGTFSAVVYAGIATGTDPLINVLVGGSTTCNIDSISCKELRPEEEWV